MSSGSRPAFSRAARTRPYCGSTKSSVGKARLNSAANRAASAGVRFAPPPPMMIGGCGSLHRFGQRRRVLDRVVGAGVVEGLAGRRGPHSGQDLELFTESLESLAERGERDGVGQVLGLEPARADSEVHPARAHRVDLGHRDGQRSGVAERRRGHQRAEPDRRGLAGDAGQRHPRVGRTGQSVTAHRHIVIGAEKR